MNIIMVNFNFMYHTLIKKSTFLFRLLSVVRLSSTASAYHNSASLYSFFAKEEELPPPATTTAAANELKV